MQQSIATPKSFRSLWDLILLAGLAALLAGLAVWMVISQFDLWPGRSVESDPLGVSQTAFIEKTGIRIIRVNVTLGGGAVTMRYQVVDPDKAVIIHDEENPPGFWAEDSGQFLNIPWHDHSNAGNLHAGVTYYEIIKNSGGAVRPGDTVTVQVGSSSLEHVVVK
jgi:hypothetical protein